MYVYIYIYIYIYIYADESKNDLRDHWLNDWLRQRDAIDWVADRQTDK